MLQVKVKQMIGNSGRPVANQFIIEEGKNALSGNCREYFQSYNAVIAFRERFTPDKRDRQVVLDSDYWDYSRTTLKYLNRFLGTSSKADIQSRIDSGKYKLANLN